MSKWLLALCAVFLGCALVITDAEAKRVGGSRSIGTQRSVTNAPPASAPARPAQQAGQQQAAPAQQPAPSGLSRWMPMLGGLALGGLLGSMLGGGGFGGLGSILLIALLAIGAVVAFRAFARKREEAAPQPMQMAGMSGERVLAPMPSQAAGLDSSSPAAAATSVPPGFDTAGFLRAAKLNFVRLQVANDKGRLDEIREFTTQEMFDELRKDVAERPQPDQQTDVINLNADLLEVATERDKHWASVRFSGVVRETPGTAPEGFEEVWNLVKPADGSSGWLLAGIQQMH